MLANLHHALPELAEKERRSIARISCRRAVEMALFVLLSPHYTREELQRRFEIDPWFDDELAGNAASPEPCVAVVPHLCLMESLTLLPLLAKNGCPQIATIYRPLKQATIEDWVLRTRERFGMRLLSRKEGFAEAIQRLRNQGVVAILFDQNAGDSGILTTLLGRVCSTTELPGMLAAKFKARYVAVWTERTGFARGTLRMEDLPRPSETVDAVFAANAWFEEKMRTNQGFREDWLWLHDRWRTQNQPQRRLQIKHRRSALNDEVPWRGWSTLPRQTRIWIRMPNWLGDAVMAMPLLRALRRSRPDAEITLLARQPLAPLLQALPEPDRVIALPGKNEAGQRRFFKGLALEYPDTQILLTHSFRGDREAKLIGAPQRLGIRRPGQPRPWINHPWSIPENFDEAMVHQTEMWRQFMWAFGLVEPPDFEPYDAEKHFEAKHAAQQKNAIALICGTENDPTKRWPVDRWRALINRFPERAFVLFGTRKDRAITDQVAADFPSDRVTNRAGETDLIAFAAQVSACAALVSNDTGGMHLANALGVPVVGVFGPTNPIRTGPCFEAPKILLQPPGCPPTGEGDIAAVTEDRVAEALDRILEGRRQ